MNNFKNCAKYEDAYIGKHVRRRESAKFADFDENILKWLKIFYIFFPII